MMDDEQREHFHQRLLEHRAVLTGQSVAGDAASEVVELDQSRVGRLSRMDALQGQAMSQAAGRRRELELTRIGAALERLDAGDYGHCLRCDEIIAPARLEIDPAATLCIRCASAEEQGGS